ncbi:MAG: hypothetical protein HDR81_04825 [Bacteroides sp.]|nr:hypothetical protein [Bacteroides sp.]
MRRFFAKAKRQADKELGTTSYRFQSIFNGGTPCGADALEWRNGDVAVPQSKTIGKTYYNLLLQKQKPQMPQISKIAYRSVS